MYQVTFNDGKIRNFDGIKQLMAFFEEHPRCKEDVIETKELNEKTVDLNRVLQIEDLNKIEEVDSVKDCDGDIARVGDLIVTSITYEGRGDENIDALCRITKITKRKGNNFSTIYIEPLYTEELKEISNREDIITTEIDSWDGFYVIDKEKRINYYENIKPLELKEQYEDKLKENQRRLEIFKTL